MKLEFSPQARLDLLEILHFIARDKPCAAIKFVDALEKQCEFIALVPLVGTDLSQISPHLRALSYRGYGLYYRWEDHAELVRIERVLAPGLNVDANYFRD